MARKGPLSGVRVVDVSQAHAGPFGTYLLGDLGAEIIKIEAPGVGDVIRDISGPRHKGEHYYWISLNRNKKGMELDLRGEQGKEVFHDLVKIADVVYDNSRPGVMKRLGADHESLKKINPRIITCSITGYGSSGPKRDLPSYDIIALGLSGMLSITGEPGRQPVRPGIALADIMGGVFGAIGVMSALYEREQTGVGRHVELDLVGPCMYLMSTFFSYYFTSGEIPPPQGGRHITLAPFGIYPTKDGYICLGLCWPRIARAVGEDWMIDDPRLATHELRQENRELLEGTLENALRKADTKDWLEILSVEDIAAAPVNNLEQAVNDPQAIYNKAIMEVEHLGERIKQVAFPIKAGIEGEYEGAPTLGQHTEEVLRNVLSYPEDKIGAVVKENEEHAAEVKEHVRRQI